MGTAKRRRCTGNPLKRRGWEVNTLKWELLKADRSWSNESNGAEMAGCISEGGRVVAYLPNHFKDAPLLCSAPELLEALKECITSEGAACFSDMKSNPQRMQIRLHAISDIARAAIAKAKGEA